MAVIPPDMERDPQLSALYRAAGEAGPPTALDDAIRAAARREVSAGPRRGGIRRWQLSLSLAAVLVLSVSLVTLMREEGADRPETLQPPPPAERLKPAEEAPLAGPAAPQAAAVPETPARRPAPPVEQPAATAAPALRSDARQGPASDAGAESRSAVPLATDAAPAVAAEGSSPRSEPAAGPMLRSAPAPLADRPAGAPTAPARSMARSAPPASDALWRDLVEAPAEKWLQRIAELRAAGRGADAEALTAEFRRRFPDVALPAEAR